MRTCENCIHYYVCANAYGILNVCGFFKDESKFIELPCSIGDIVYELDVIVDDEFCYTCEYYTPEYPGDPEYCAKTCAFHRAKECIKIKERKTTLRSISNWMLCDEFGKTVFLTREEAENRLQEINSNAKN